ncbi:MAG: pyrroline-5-carboxylate reductase [Clostridiaceae bacterium]|nr:pyrroline-5-carboxylate reductase [Clostridiaceae bacterium]
MNKKIGFIGVGNMGGAIAKSLISSGKVRTTDIYVTDLDKERTDAFAKLGAVVCDNAVEIAEKVDVVVLAVKPIAFECLLNSVSSYTKPLYISIAAGITIDYIKGFSRGAAKVVRAMPNIPVLVGEGTTIISYKPPATEADELYACELFENVGIVQRMNEKCFNTAIALTSSSPAYVSIMIEAMADAAVSGGIPRNMAYRLAAQAVAGSAKMLMQTGLHPAQLKDMVCSPGGTTIKAVEKLEERGFRNALISAMRDCSKRSAQIMR